MTGQQISSTGHSPPARLVARGIVAVLVATLVVVAPSLPGNLLPTREAQAATLSYSYSSFTSGATWSVPYGVASITISLFGGAAGNGGVDGAGNPGNGGARGYVQATLAVSTGDVIGVYPGGSGSNGASAVANTGGGSGGLSSYSANYNGGSGGNAGSTGYSGGGGGGGAASIVTRNSAIQAIAAGAGGGGGGTNNSGVTSGSGTTGSLRASGTTGASGAFGGDCGSTDGGGGGGGGGGNLGGNGGTAPRYGSAECLPNGGSAGSNFLIAAATATTNNTSSSGAGTISIAYTMSQTSTPVLAAASDTGSSNSDGITSATTPTFTGTATGGSSVQLRTNGTNTGSACIANATTGAWSCTTGTLAAGTQTITAVATSNGDTSTSSGASVTIDNVAPTATATTASIQNAASATIQSNETGTAYLVRSSVTVSNLASITSAADNVWNSATVSTANSPTSVSASGLIEGTYRAYVVDTAGNLSSASTNSVTVNAYTLTYDSQGGSNVGASQWTEGNAITLPTPTRAGYTFRGWSTNASGSTKVYETTQPRRSGNAIVYASGYGKGGSDAAATLTSAGATFNRVRYRMEANYNGTLRYADVSFDKWSGATISSLAVPDLDDARNIKTNVSNLSIDSNWPGFSGVASPVTTGSGKSGRLELWARNYGAGTTGITPAGNPAIFDSDDTEAASGEYGSFQVHNLTDGQTVLAWNRHFDATLDGPDIGFGNFLGTGLGGQTGNTDWTFAQKTNFNTATWKLGIYIGDLYTGGSSYTPTNTADFTLYAQWVADPYSVTYNGNSNTGGTAPTDSNVYNYGNTVTALGNTGTLTNGSLTFSGWCTTQPAVGSACSGTSVAAGSTFTISGNTTLYAVWLDTTAPTVTAFSSSTADGSYTTGQSINITATTSEAIRSGNTLTVSLNSGATVLLTAASAGTSLTGTYSIASGENSSDLTVSSFTIGTVLDTAGNAMSSTTVPSGTSNIGGAKALVVDTTTPAAPTALSATPLDSSATISFTAGAAGPSGITNYKYSLDGTTYTALSPADAASPVTITGLTNGTTYTVRLKAVSAAGDGTASASVTVTPRTTPSTPSAPTVTAGDGEVSLTWVAPSDGGNAISGYNIQFSTALAGTYSDATGDCSPASRNSSTALTCTMSSLTNNTTYYFKVRAKNDAGWSAYSSASSAAPLKVIALPTDYALSLDGTTHVAAMLDPGTTSVLDLDNFTIEAWVYPTSNTTESMIMNKESAYELAIRSGDLNYAIANSTGGWAWYSTGLTISTNTWTHIAFTKNSNTVTVYLNGVQRYTETNSTKSPADVYDSNVPFSVGGRASACTTLPTTCTYGSLFLGRMNDVRLWNGTRTAAQIAAFYDERVASNLGTWLFDENGGSIAYNSARTGGSTLNLTLAGTPAWTSSVNTSSTRLAAGYGGSVSGFLPGYSTNGNVTFSKVAGSEVNGTVSITAGTGAFTFTPTASQDSLGSFDYVTTYSSTNSTQRTFTIGIPPVPTALALTPIGGTNTPGYLNATNTNVTASVTIDSTYAVGGRAELYVDGTLKATDSTIANGDTTASFSLGTASNSALSTAIGAPAASGTSKAFTVKLFDAAGNTSNASAATNVIADFTAPTISSFSSSTTDGTYGVGGSIAITATASENIRSGNTITATLNSGATVVLTAPAAGTTFSGTYTVAAGQNSADLTVSSFTIGTVADTAGNAMTSTTVPTGTSNIAGVKALVIDTIAPSAPTTLDLATASDTGTSNSDNITGVTTPTISLAGLESGASVTISATKASTTETCTFTASATTGSCALANVTEGTWSITAKQTDPVSNESVASSALTIYVDTTGPAAPTGLSASVSSGSATITFTPGSGGPSAVTNYKYSTDGVTYTALSPADGTSPITVTGLTNGTTYSIRLKTVTAMGDSVASSAVSATPSKFVGLSTVNYTEQDPAVDVAAGIEMSGGTSYDGKYIDFAIGSPQATEFLGYRTVATAVTTNGEVSIVGTSVYLGNGTTAEPIGSIDATRNGQDGQPLRINFVNSFSNASFEEATLTGWTALEQQIVLGTTSIAGYVAIDRRNYSAMGCANDYDDGVYTGSQVTWTRKTVSLTSSTASAGSKSLLLDMYAQSAISGGWVIHGPAVYSADFEASLNDVISFDWKAIGGGDDYSVFGYILNTSNGAQTTVLDAYETRDGLKTNWTTASVTIPATGTYKFVFVAGAHNADCGRQGDAKLYIDNVQVFGSKVNDAVATKVARLVTYRNTSDAPTTSRTVTLSTNPTGGTVSTTFNIAVTAVDDAPSLGSTSQSYTNAESSAETFTPKAGTLSGSDPDGDTLTYSLPNGTAGSTTYSSVTYDAYETGAYGTLWVKSTTGQYYYAPDNTAINNRLVNDSETFDIRVSASSVDADSTFTLSVAITAAAPAAPTGLTVTPGVRALNVSWTAPTWIGGSAVTGYRIEYSTNNTTWTTASDNSSTSTSLRITGVADATAYYVRVASKNTNGTGTYASSSPTTYTTFDKPTSLTLAPVGGTVVSNTLNSTNTNLTAQATIVAGRLTGGTATLYKGSTALATDTSIGAADTTVDFDLSSSTTSELQGLVATGGTMTVKVVDANGLETLASTGVALTADYVRPTVTISRSGTGVLNQGTSDSVIFSLSESSANFVVGDVSATGGTLSAFSGSGATYTATFTVSAGATGTATISVLGSALTDAAGNGNTASNTLTITLNSAPTLATPSTALFTDTIASDTFANATGTLSGADADSGDTLTYGLASGTDNGTTVSRTGTYGTLTVTKATGAYSFAPNNATINARSANATETHTVNVTDGIQTATATFTVSITAANDAPVMTAVTSNFLDTAATDTLTVATGTFAATDVESNTISTWGITGASTVSSLLAWTSGSITFDRLLVGTYGSLYVRSSTGQYRFEPNNTAVNALATGTSETFPVTVADNLGAASTGSYTASITAVNDRPVVTVTAADLADVTNGLATGAYTLYHSSAFNGTGSTPGGEEVYRAFDDSNSTKYLNYSGAGSGVTIDLGAGNAYAVNGLGLTTANDSSDRDPTAFAIYGSNDGSSFTLVNSGAVSPPSLRQTDYPAVSFTNATNYRWYRVVFTAVRGAGSLMQIAEIRLPAQSGNQLTYTEGASAGVVLTGIDVSDSDTASLTGATASITAGLTTGDVLSFANDGSTMGSISGTYDSSTGVLTLTGAGTPAEYQAAFRAVKFRNTTNNPTGVSSTRTVSWRANDGDASNNLSLTATSTITVVETVPSISSISVTSSAGSDNRYAIGDVIEVTANFTEAVAVTNSPRIPVTNLSGKYFTYASGSGTAALTFTYTVALGDSAALGVGIAANTLALNGGTINDSVGAATTITHSAISASTSHIVDGVLPTVSSFTTSKANGSYMAGESIAISATISETVQAGATIEATLDSGPTITLTTATAGTTLTGTYTVAAGQNSADLTVSSFTITSVLDLAGNAMTSTTLPTGSSNIADAKAIVIDTIAPTVVSILATPDGRYRGTQAFTVTAVASESVRSGSTISVTFDTGVSLTLTQSGGGTNLVGTYTVQAGENTADLSATAFTIGSVLDTAGNSMTSTTLPTGSNVVGSGTAVIIDTTAPTIISFSSTTADGAYKAGQTINITATTSEPIQSGNSLSVTLNSGGTATLTAAAAGTSLTGTYTILATHTAADLTVSSFAIVSLADTAGNALTSTSLPTGANVADTSAIVIDTTAPTVTQMSVSADGWYKAGQSFTVTATVSEPIRAGSSLTLTFDTGETLALTASAAGTTLSNTYTVVAGRNSADLTVSSFAVTSVLDPAGNAMTSTALPTGNNAIGSGSAVVIDTTAPTISAFTTAKPNGWYKAGENITITATISESVQAGASVDATLSTGTIVTLTTGTAGTTLTGVYTVAAGENSADLTVDSFTITGVLDTAANAMTSTTLPTGTSNIAGANAIVIDTIAPTITQMSVSANGSYKAGQSITITATASEAVRSGNTLTVSFDTGETLTLTAPSAGTSFTGTYTVAAGINSTDLTVTSFVIDAVLDTAGNAMTSTTLPTGNNAIGPGTAVIIDTVAPTITAFTSTTANGAYKAGQTINITATVSEPIGAGNSISVVLNSGATVTLSTPADNTTWSGGGCGPYPRQTVTGRLTGGTVWGTGPYTDDSDFNRAAVHAGLVAVGQTAVIEPYAINNYPSYSGSTQNGVSTSVWSTSWCGYSIRLATASQGSSYTTLTGSYTIVAGNTAASLSVNSFTIVGVTDGAGNAMSSTSLPTGANVADTSAIVVDTTAPTIVSFSTTTADGAYKAGQTIDLTATTSEPVMSGNSISVTLSSGTTVTLTAAAAGTTLAATYTIASGQNSSDLTVSSFSIISVADPAANAMTSTTVPTGSSNIGGARDIIVDTVAPTLTTFSSAMASPTNLTTLTYTLTFSEAVTGIDYQDFSNAGSAVDCVFDPGTDTGASRTLTITLCSGGTVQPIFAANAAIDIAANSTQGTAATSSTTINRRFLRTITFSTTSFTKTYGDAPFFVSASPSRGAGDGAVSYAVSAGTCSVDVTTGEVTILGAGSCSVSATVAEGTNNQTATTGTQVTVSIAKKALMITASSHAVTYGDTPPTITPSYSAFAYNESAADLTTAPTCSSSYSTTSTALVNVATSCASADSANYELSYTAGTITIAKQPTTVVFTTSSLTHTFNGDTRPALTTTSPAGKKVVFSYVGPNHNSATAPVNVGTYTVTATVEEANFIGTATTTMTINKAAQTAITFANPTSVVFGSSLQIVTTGGNGSGALTYSVKSGPCTLSSSHVLSNSGAGSCVVGATRAASTNYLAASADDLTVAVSKQAQSVAFTTVVPSSPVAGGTYTPKATATSGLGVAISITAGESTVCSLANGVVTFIAKGSCTVTARQAGDANFLPADAANQTIAVGTLNQTITFAQPAERRFGDAPFALEASSSSGLSVVFAAKGAACTVSTGGVVSIVAPGACDITVSQAGDASYAAAAAVTRTLVVKAGLPGVPHLMSASPSDSTIVVAYSEPPTDGGSPLLSYMVVATPTSGDAVSRSDCSLTSTSCALLGLSNGTQYRVKVAAITAAGVGDFSVESDPVTPFVAPEAVQDLTGMREETSLKIEWADPDSFGGGTLVRYEVSIREKDGDFTAPVQVSAVRGIRLFSVNRRNWNHTFSNLSKAKTYEVKVVTITNLSPTSNSANTAQAIVQKMNVAEAPRNLTVEATSMTSATVAWATPLRDGGAPITSYSITSSNGTCEAASPLALTCELKSASSDKAVTINVKAVTKVGASEPAIATISLPGRPGAPTITGVTRKGTSATISWKAPDNTGGRTITSYRITGASTLDTKDTPICSATETTCTVEGLSMSAAYNFSARAFNAFGEGAASANYFAQAFSAVPAVWGSISESTERIAIGLPPAPGSVKVLSSSARRSNVIATAPKTSIPITHAIITVAGAKGRVVLRVKVAVNQANPQAAITIPYSSRSVSVAVQFANAFGVSAMAATGWKPATQITRLTDAASNVQRGVTSAKMIPFGSTVGAPVYFIGASSQLSAAAKAELARIAATLKRDGGIVNVTGYARYSPSTSTAFMRKVSEQRALVVANYLATLGVQQWIRFQGVGSPTTKTGPDTDRRVVVSITPFD